MNSPERHVFELHHCIEQNKAFDRSVLLQKLTAMGLYDIDGPRNTINLPDSKQLAADLGISPHTGGHFNVYSDGLLFQLDEIAATRDGKAALNGDREAAAKVVQRVHDLEDTIKVGLIRGDVYTNVPAGMSYAEAKQRTQDFFDNTDQYARTHAKEIASVSKLPPPESDWAAVVKSEGNVLKTVQAVNQPGYKPIKADALDGHLSLRQAINQAHAANRLTVSEPNVTALREAFAPHIESAADRAAAKAPGRGAMVKSIIVGGAAVSLAEAAEASERISSALDRDNPLAAQSHAMHYGGRGVGGVAGGAAAGLIAGSWTGPGALITVAVGAYTGSEAGEKVAKWWDNRQVYHQTDRDNVSWEFTGRQWVRERTADLSRDGIDNPTVTTFAAPPEKARELNLAALNAATALELKDVPPPRSPFIQPQSPGDTPSLDPAPWERNSRTGQWERNVVVGRIDHGANDIRPEIASPQRAAALEQAADQVIRENIANGPAPIASRYEIAFRASGFDGDKLLAATTALAQGYVTASNGELYRRDDAGQWLSPNGAPAPGNLPVELERTNAELAPQLAQHRQYVAALSPAPAPAAQDRDRAILLDTYQQRGVNPTPEQMDASMLAISRTREANGIAPGMTTFQLEPNADRGYDVRSPIAHVYGSADGVRRIAAVTTAPEIAQALTEVQARPAPVPDTPELRIEALSPQQREAQEQALREANRLGLSRDDVQLTAQQAAAAAAIAADREPEIVTRPIDAARAQATPSQDAQAAPAPASPAPSRPTVPPPPKAEPPPDAAQAQTRSDEARKPVEPAQSAAETQASPRPLPAQNDAQAAPPSPGGQDDALRRGSEGQDVALLQYRLDRMGYRGPGESPLPQTGQFDAATEHGVRQFQEANRLPSTGVVDPDTVQALAVAQQTRAVRPSPSVQLDQPDEPKAEREPAARSYDAPSVPAAPIPPSADRDDRLASQDARDEHRAEFQLSAPLISAAPAVEDRPQREDVPDRPATIPETPGAERDGATADAPPLSHEPVPAPAVPAATAETPTPIEPGTVRDHAAELSERAAPPPPLPTAPEAEPVIDLSHFSRSDQAMIAKIRANVPEGLSDEHAAAAMLAAKRNGIQDVDRLGPVAVVGETLWMGGKVEGFHTALNVAEQAPPLQDTVRETAQFNYDQAQKQAQEQAQQQQQQQGQEQTDKLLKMSLM